MSGRNQSNFLSDRLSSRARAALQEAQNVSFRLQSSYTGTEHLLFGIVSEPSSFVSKVLFQNRINKEQVYGQLLKLNNEPQPPDQKPLYRGSRLSQSLVMALEKAAVVAAKHEYQFVGTEHFLYGLLDQETNRAIQILVALEIDIAELKKNLVSIFENVSKFPDLTVMPDFHSNGEEPVSSSALNYFTHDLTERAKKGLIDPLIGRKKELERVISILNRRTKNNPVLIGEPGVGKTAIVEGLTLLIHHNKAPANLLGRKILTLDLALLVAGSMFRGEFENRLKQIIDEVKQAQNIILFIDELHTVVGAGSTPGSLDAANILKPALSRGEIRVIGATTLKEYKKYIEQDAALERRFQPIIVREPNVQETLQILKGLRPYYEAHHGVKIADQALQEAVRLSLRYLSDRFLPDKAIDLVDETAAFCKTKILTAKQSPFSRIAQNLSVLSHQKREAVLTYDLSRASVLQKKEQLLSKYQEKIQNAERDLKISPLTITAQNVAETIARITGTPLSTLVVKETEKLLSLQANLEKHIVGQEKVLQEITATIYRSRAGLASQNRPLASFLFLGPSGVGKTLVAKCLAKELFEDQEALIRLDMSELMERHNVARLIGAPAGYVGYEEGGKLTESVRQRPYAVVLFDDVEKAHRDIMDLLLQILEEGELTDATGKKVNFRNTMIILTSNLGLPALNQLAKSFGFTEKMTKRTQNFPIDDQEIKERVLKEVRSHFRPEFLNRLDKILIFDPLSRGHIKKIIKLELQKIKDKIAEQNITLEASEKVCNYLANLSFDPQQGARSVRKNLQELVENLIAENLLKGKIKELSKVLLNLEGKSVTLKIL